MTNTRRGKGKVFILLGVLLAVAGLTLGFAAFSNTLTIKSSATVTPSSDTFKILLSSSDSSLDTSAIEPNYWSDTGVSNFTASNAVINNSGNPTLSGIQVNFTEPGQEAYYAFYVRNEGEYVAYFNEIKFNNVSGSDSHIVCTADTDENGNPLATQALVDEACKNISITVNYDVENAAFGYSSSEVIMYEDYGHYLSIGKTEFEDMALFINYASGAAVADGPFTIEIGDIEMIWSTVPNE